MTTPEENLEMTTSDELRKWAERNAPDARILGSMIIFNPDMDDPPSPEDLGCTGTTPHRGSPVKEAT